MSTLLQAFTIKEIFNDQDSRDDLEFETPSNVYQEFGMRRHPRDDAQTPHTPSSTTTETSQAAPLLEEEEDHQLVVEGTTGHSYELLELISELPRSQRLRHIYPDTDAAVAAVAVGSSGGAVIWGGEFSGDSEVAASTHGRRLGSTAFRDAVSQLLPWRGLVQGFRALSVRTWRRGHLEGSCPSPSPVPALLQLGPHHTELVKVRVGLW